MIASVVIDRVSKEINDTYDYFIPDDLEEIIIIGRRVFIPFGKSNKVETGFVIEKKDSSDIDLKKIKNIIDVADYEVWFDSEILNLAYYLKDNYMCTLSEALKTILPSGTSFKEEICIKLNNWDKVNLFSSKYIEIINNLYKDKYTSFSSLKKEMNTEIKKSELLYLKSKNIIEIKSELKQKVKKKQKTVYMINDICGCVKFIENERRSLKQVEIINGLYESGCKLTSAEITKKYNCSISAIKSLEKKGLLKSEVIEEYRNPDNFDYNFKKVKLNISQNDAINKILKSLNSDKKVTLISGVTGCGKTEIYLNVVENMIKNGYGSIVLVPEISLTPQTLERFKGRFGDSVAVIHSRLTNGERFDEWRRIKNGNVKVVVGARSAVFSPVNNLKAIIMDEEHEYSYKSDMTPRYMTKVIAEYRIQQNNGILVLGSATPSIESYYQSENNNYNLIEINDRVDDKRLPEVEIIDMRNELLNGNKSIFSRKLYENIQKNLENNEQTIIFLNRRGFSTFVSCRECGYVCKCDNCDTTLTYHINNGKLVCHYCGKEYKSPVVCPKCGSKYIKYFGSGTEKVQKEITKFFPTARILRMDMDTTRKKGEFKSIYNTFRNHDADILIGTQMIAKGMDFKDVTLVGVIAADMSLNIPNFRANERTFQLLTQVSGRAGRGNKYGKVIVQTYEPDNYSINYAKAQDYKSFYLKEITLRKVLNNPPFSDILYLLFVCENESKIIEIIEDIFNAIKNIVDINKCDILGPAPCQISKIKNKYRWQITLKGEVKNYQKQINLFLYNKLKEDEVKYIIDLNPYNMF